MTPSQMRQIQDGWKEVRRHGLFAMACVGLLIYIHFFFVDPLMTDHKTALSTLSKNLEAVTKTQELVVNNQGKIIDVLNRLSESQERVMRTVDAMEQRIAAEK